MKVTLYMKPFSKWGPDPMEFEDVIEVHWRYGQVSKCHGDGTHLAIELEDTGMTFPTEDIFEFEVKI